MILKEAKINSKMGYVSGSRDIEEGKKSILSHARRGSAVNLRITSHLARHWAQTNKRLIQIPAGFGLRAGTQRW